MRGSYPLRQSRQIADDALASQDKALEAAQSWWAPLAGDPKVPAILRTAALNQLGQVAFKTSMWAAGFVSSPDSPPLGQRLRAGTPGTPLDLSPSPVNGVHLSVGG